MQSDSWDRLLCTVNFLLIMLMLFDNIAYNKQMRIVIQAMVGSMVKQLQIQLLIALVMFPLAFLLYMEYCVELTDFQSISWAFMTLFKMTLGDNLALFYNLMLAVDPSIAYFFLIVFTILLRVFYALILGVVCEQYEKLRLGADEQGSQVNLVNSVFCCQISKRKKELSRKAVYRERQEDKDDLFLGSGFSGGFVRQMREVHLDCEIQLLLD